MSVSLIAIISLGAPAYGYVEPFRPVSYFPRDVYAADYDPFYDDPYYKERVYEEPVLSSYGYDPYDDGRYYGDPYYPSTSYATSYRRGDLGDTLLLLLGVGLLSKILDADVDFVIGAPVYYRPYPVFYRRYYRPVAYYRPYYVYDPWYPTPVRYIDPWYCPPPRFVAYREAPHFYCGAEPVYVAPRIYDRSWDDWDRAYDTYDRRTYDEPLLASVYEPTYDSYRSSSKTSWREVSPRLQDVALLSREQKRFASGVGENLAWSRFERNPSAPLSTTRDRIGKRPSRLAQLDVQTRPSLADLGTERRTARSAEKAKGPNDLRSTVRKPTMDRQVRASRTSSNPRRLEVGRRESLKLERARQSTAARRIESRPQPRKMEDRRPGPAGSRRMESRPQPQRMERQSPRFDRQPRQIDTRGPQFESRPQPQRMERQSPRFDRQPRQIDTRGPRFESRPQPQRMERQSPRFDRQPRQFDTRGPRFESRPQPQRMERQSPRFERQPRQVDTRRPRFESRPQPQRMERQSPRFDRQPRQIDTRGQRFESRPQPQRMERQSPRFDRQPRMETRSQPQRVESRGSQRPSQGGGRGRGRGR